MTRDEAIIIMQQQLGFRSDQADNCVIYLKLAQQQLELEPIKPWFLVSESLTALTTATEDRIGVPPTMLEEYDDAALFYVPDEGDDEGKNLDLRKDEYDVLVANYRDTAAGEPKSYALRGGYFILFPTPDDAYTIKIVIYAQDDILNSNIENKWLKYAPLLLIGKALQYIPSALRDSVALQTGKDWEQQGRLAVFTMNETRDLANRELQMGGPH